MTIRKTERFARLMRIRQPLFALPLFLITLVPAFSREANAVSSKVWQESAQPSLLKGKTQGIAITGRGELELATALEELFDCEEPMGWSLAALDDGSVILGTGSSGKIFRIRDKGKAEELAHLQALEVFAVESNGKDIFAAASPGNKIVLVSEQGKAELFCQLPDVEYVWALLLDQKGSLYAATGNSGKIYKISGQGKAEVFYDSDETSIVSLAGDGHGGLYAGSNGSGLLYHISEKGEARVIYDSSLKEIRQIRIGEDGTVYAVGDSGPAYPAAPPPKKEKGASSTESSGDSETIAEGEEGSATIVVTPESESKEEKRGEVVALSPEGSARVLYESKDALIFSLAVLPDRTLIAGIGDELRRILDHGEYELLYKFENTSLTAVLRAKDRGFYFCTSGLTKVYKLGPGYARTGSYTSPVKDSQAVSKWGRLWWEEEPSKDVSVTFRFRSGNTGTPDSTWSSWSEPMEASTGSRALNATARFAQWEIRMKSIDGKATSLVRMVRVSYMQNNLPPVLVSVTVHGPGVVYSKDSSKPCEAGLEPVPGEVETIFKELNPSAGDADDLGKRLYRKGARTVTCQSSDPNGDEMQYCVYYKAEGETAWKLMKEKNRKQAFSFDSGVLPDGQYRVRVVVDDGLSNPNDAVLKDERTSEPFVVDNTPPEIRSVQAVQEGADVRLAFSVLDKLSRIVKAEYSIDARDFQAVAPVDGISDVGAEQYSTIIHGIDPGEHTLIVRGVDEQNNASTAAIVVAGGR